MRSRLATLALFAAIGCAAPALADGMPRTAATTAPAYAYPAPEALFYNWSGVYIGAHIGAMNASGSGTFDDGTAVAFSAQDASFVGGGHVGLQFQLRELVLGAEYSYSALSASLGSPISTGYTVTTKLKDLQIVSGKIGYAYQNYLFYGKAGYAFSSLDYSADNGTVSNGSGRGNGWMGGLGVSYAITPRIILGAEYNYVNISTDNATLGAGTLTGNNIDLQIGTLRLDFKFGG